MISALILPQKGRKTKPLRIKNCVRGILLIFSDKDCLSQMRRYNLLSFSRYFIHRSLCDK
ncbi:hypothetical protein CU280_03470 [Yersinia mollaretii]|nr:hypothetical protein CU280_03470 [Yersinia mollaretii]